MNKQLNLIYQRLYAHFGPQAWWPADNPFEVIVGAILTQNTNWTNVERVINNLKKHKLLAPDKLYRLSYKKLALLIRQVGFYNIKTRRLKKFLGFFIKHYQGSLKKMSCEDTYNLRGHLLSINGIGPETADSILLYALDKPIFVVDAYTRRILNRHRLIKDNASYDDIQNLFMQNLKNNVNHARNTKSPREKDKISNVVKLFNEYHALLVKLGKEFCLKNKPRCDICPLK